MRKLARVLVTFAAVTAIIGCGKKAEAPQQPGASQPDTPKQQVKGPQADPDKLVEQAQAAKDGKDLDSALSLVDQALAADPDHVEANWLKAWVLAGKEDAAGAVRQFEHMLVKLDLDEERTKQANEALARLRSKAGKPAPSEKPAPVVAPTPATAPAPAPSSASWPGWRGPNRDGKSPDTGLLKQWPAGGPSLIWKATGIGKGFSSIAVTGGLVYTAGDVDGKMKVFAFDMNGKPKWSIAHDDGWSNNHPGARSTPVIDNGKLYIISGHGLVGCYNAANGQKIWTRKMSEFGGKPGGWGYAESVLIHGNLAIVTPGGSKCIVALDKNTGKDVWASSGFTAGAQYGSCIAVNHGGATMIVAGTHDGIVGVNAKDGKLLWQNKHAAGNTANAPTPAYADGYVFWAVGYGKGGVCLKLGRRGSAKQAWTTKDMDCHHGGYLIKDGYLYGNNGGGFACLDLKTGKKLWQERAVGKGSLCYADGMLYLFGESGGKVALATCSPQGTQVTGEFSVQGTDMSWAHPVVIGGRLYLRYADNLYCYNVKAG